MDWPEALEVVATSHPRYRYLCGEENPDPVSRAAYRRLVIRLAGGEVTEPESVPQPALVQPAAVTIPAPGIPLAGDLIAAATHLFGADRLARWVAAKRGKDCGCADRQRWLNELDAKVRNYLRSRPHPKGSTPDGARDS